MRTFAIVALVVLAVALAEAGSRPMSSKRPVSSSVKIISGKRLPTSSVKISGKPTSSVKISGAHMGGVKVNYRTRRQIPLLGLGAGALPLTYSAGVSPLLINSAINRWSLPSMVMPYSMPLTIAPAPILRSAPLPAPYGFDAYAPAIAAMNGLEEVKPVIEDAAVEVAEAVAEEAAEPVAEDVPAAEDAAEEEEDDKVEIESA